MESILSIKNLHSYFSLDAGVVRAVQGVTLDIPRGQTTCLLGESGCGKSITAFSILRLLPSPGKIVRGSIIYHRAHGDVDITALREDGAEMRAIRGKEIAMVFQEPMTSLSPVHTIGNQILEMVKLHTKLRGTSAKQRVIEVMRQVEIPDPEQRFRQYSHELSGGLRQRAMIAMALACSPSLLIADEPSTALDVTIQAQILQLLRDIQAKSGMSILLITHDFGVVAEMAQQVAVMYLGKIVEHAEVAPILSAPRHPYTRALLESIPGRDAGKAPLPVIPGIVPDPFTQLAGCPFHPRCQSFISGVCDQGLAPELREVADGHQVACHLYDSENISRRK